MKAESGDLPLEKLSGRTPHRGVLVGADGSPASNTALRWAAHEAALRHLPLTIIHADVAVPVAVSTLTWPARGVPRDVLQTEEDQAHTIIAEAIKVVEETSISIGTPEVNSELIVGEPIPTLVDLSKEAAMVVVGAKGRNRQQDRLVGSVTAGLLRHAHCPIAVVPAAVDSAARSALPVLLGVDGSRASTLATDIAFDEASCRGVGLTALHVFSDSDISVVSGIDAMSVQSAAAMTLERFLEGWQRRYPEVAVDRLIEFQHPTRRLLDNCERSQLVVLGSHGRGAFAGMMLGSVSDAVARAAPVPVIVARRR